MSNRRRKGKAYRPHVIAPLVLRAIGITQEQRALVMARFGSSLLTIENGSHPGEAEWRDLSDVVNLVETLCLRMQQLLVVDEVMPDVRTATSAMVAAAHRWREGKGMRLSGEGLKALRSLLSAYDQCLAGLSAADLMHALRLTEQVVRDARAGKSRTGTEIVFV